MNRPKRKAFVKKYGCEHTERYIQALETYSKELERKHDDIKHLCDLEMFSKDNYKKEIEKLEKALDKACALLTYDQFNAIPPKELLNLCMKDWKEWLMKDE